MTASLRVLLIAAANSTSGGGEKHVADLLKRLPARGVTVGLVAPAGGDLAALCDELGVREYPVPIDAGFSASRLTAVRDAVSDFAPDVVHAHGSRAAAFARMADRRAGRRVVYTVHGIHVSEAGSGVRRVALTRLERLLRARTARFVTVAASDTRKGEELCVLDPDRTVTVYNGIELPPAPGTPGNFRDELGLGPDVPLVLSVGRFHEQKDQRTLLSAFARVLGMVPGAHLALVGSGDLEGALREWSVALGVNESVSFVAPRPDLADAYVDADIVALSSRWEGLPYVVLEAMAYGRPVVATSVDGIPEAVEDGESGLLAPVGDDEALGDALSALLADPDRRAAMGGRARSIVSERFSLGRMIDELLGVYGEVARGSSSS